jgi:hypothetical protein
MRYTFDPIQRKELSMRATAALTAAVARDSRFSSDPAEWLTHRGLAQYAGCVDSKAAVTAADVQAALAPLNSAFVLGSDSRSIIPPLVDAGALVLPLVAAARILVGSGTATTVGESSSKPITAVDFRLSDDELIKAVALLVTTTEAIRGPFGVQEALQRHLAARTAVAVNTALFSRFTTSGTAAASADPGVLLATLSGGAARAPILFGAFGNLLTLAPGVLRDLRDLGVTVVATPEAGDDFVMVDAAGVLIADGGVELNTAAHASLDMDGGSPATATFSLWQHNCVGVRAERRFQIDFKTDSVVYAAVGSPA